MIDKLLKRTSVRSYLKDKKLDSETYNKLIDVINIPQHQQMVMLLQQ